MSTSDVLGNARKSIQEILKTIQFKKAVNEREKAVKIQMAHQQCNGVLERSRVEFDNTIRDQFHAIKAGAAEGQITKVQRDKLCDAALGYIIVKDAMYAVKSVGDDDSMYYAYHLLDFAVYNLTGEKKHPIKSWITERKANRSAFADQVTEEAFQERVDLASAILPELLQTGDIETCLKHTRIPPQTEKNIEYSRLSSGLPASLNDLTGTAASPVSNAASDAAAFLDAQTGSGNQQQINLGSLSKSFSSPEGFNPSDHE